VGNLLAEFLADFDGCDRGVFDRIMKQARGDRDRVHLHVGEHVGHLQRMDEIRLARGAGLARVVLLGKIDRLS